MILSEYDEERHMRQTYEEGREEGEKAGIKKTLERVNALNQFLVDHNWLEDLKRSISDPEFQKKLFEEIGV